MKGQKYDTPTTPPIPKRLMVVGSPRSGTHFITTLLNLFGMRVSHERMGEDGIVNAAWLAMRKPNDALINPMGRQHYEFDRIIHLVRNPLDTIGSLQCEMTPIWWEWQKFHTNVEITDPSDLEKVAAFWVCWTDGCQRLADASIKLEHIRHLGQPEGVGVAARSEVKIHDLGAMQETVEQRMEFYGYKQ